MQALQNQSAAGESSWNLRVTISNGLSKQKLAGKNSADVNLEHTPPQKPMLALQRHWYGNVEDYDLCQLNEGWLMQ